MAHQHLMLRRRDVLGAAFAATALHPAWANADLSTGPFAEGRRRLIVLRLLGGNDNLNTLVPYREELYRRYRPDLALKAKEQLRLNSDFAFNAALKHLYDMWQHGEVAVVHDVGKPGGELSHFVSGDSWSTGALPGSDEMTRRVGWIGRTLQANGALLQRSAFDADAVVLGKDAMSMESPDVRAMMIEDVASVSALADESLPAPSAQASPAQQHVLRILQNAVRNGQVVREKLSGSNPFVQYFATANYLSEAQRQVATLLWMVERGLRTPVYQIELNGFDMHAHLRGEHDLKLGELDDLLHALRFNLKKLGVWHETMILAYSEFGRRPQQNASYGTDHGSAGPVFMIGGGLTGGLYGRPADLAVLDRNGNLLHGVDFRQVYATVVERFWGLPANPLRDAGFAALPMRLSVA